MSLKAMGKNLNDSSRVTSSRDRLHYSVCRALSSPVGEFRSKLALVTALDLRIESLKVDNKSFNPRRTTFSCAQCDIKSAPLSLLYSL